MLFDTIQNKQKPFSFTYLLKARLLSALTTLIIHGIVLALVLFVVPLVQVNVFEEELINVFIAPGDPLMLPDTEGLYEGTDDLESNKSEENIPRGVMVDSGTGEGSLESEERRRENSVLSTPEESSTSSTIISEFRLDKKAGTLDKPGAARDPLLILSLPESRKNPSEKDDILPEIMVDFNKYLEPEFPRTSSLANRRGMGAGSSKVRGQQARAVVKGAQLDVTPWASVVVERIQKNWNIPSDRENPAKGKVGIDVKISKKGDLVDIQVIESSLIQSFDLAALAAIKDSAPFPSLPSAYPGVFLQIYFIFQYND